MNATYRLQLTPTFGFDEARNLIPYFSELGIGHLYLSPITEAAEGSMHGYDVVDHTAVRGAFGGRAGFEELRSAAVDAGLGIVLDFVPNHVSIDALNRNWQDVLAHGRDSEFARFFDIDWNPPQPELSGKVLLPFLGKPLEEAIADGEVEIVEEGGRHYAAYFDHRFALDPGTLPNGASLNSSEGLDNGDSLNSGGNLSKGDKNELRALLDRQHWQLAHYELADAVNYRRFFNINGLIGLRQEDPDVFEATHRLLFELMEEEGVDGVRIDHIDGMADPHAYLERLRARTPGSIWVEKILAPDEELPPEWPVEGTTGYRFMNDVLHLLVDGAHMGRFDTFYKTFTGQDARFSAVEEASKKHVMDTLLKSDLDRLAFHLHESATGAASLSPDELRSALRELVAHFPRYRTYLPHNVAQARQLLNDILDSGRLAEEAEERCEWIRDVLLGDTDMPAPDRLAWTTAFQQFTSPVAAKGVEDTAFYRYVRFAALNEVGGDPDAAGSTVDAFHDRIARFYAPRHGPTGGGLLASATHDHKRGEDTRMRLAALSEMPERWEEAVEALEEIAERYDDISAVHRYLVYQTLAALWMGPEPVSEGSRTSPVTSPAERPHDPTRLSELSDRLWTYMQKAAREGKEQTTWLDPTAEYEQALEDFTRGLVTDSRTAEALSGIAGPVAQLGFANSLTQTVLKCTLPGIPDVYQGSELLDLSLVDPDNRRLVDFSHRRTLLKEIAPLLDDPNQKQIARWIVRRDPRAKLYFLATLLRLRRSLPAVFSGEFQRLDAGDETIAFVRTATGNGVRNGTRNGALTDAPSDKRTGPPSGKRTGPPRDTQAGAPRGTRTGAHKSADDEIERPRSAIIIAPRLPGRHRNGFSWETYTSTGKVGPAAAATSVSVHSRSGPAHLPDYSGTWKDVLTGTVFSGVDLNDPAKADNSSLSTDDLPLPWAVLCNV